MFSLIHLQPELDNLIFTFAQAGVVSTLIVGAVEQMTREIDTYT